MIALYVVRHGIAVDAGTPGYADSERPLTREGEQKMREVAEGLKQLGVKVDRILTSPLPRAARTAEIIAATLDAAKQLETVEALSTPHGAASIADWLQTRPEARLMLVGHNPSLSDLIALLITGDHRHSLCDLRKGGVAYLEGTPGGDMHLEWLAPPKLLRRIDK